MQHVEQKRLKALKIGKHMALARLNRLERRTPVPIPPTPEP
jgi:hypothetical protein